MANTPDPAAAHSAASDAAMNGDPFGQYVDASFDELADSYRLMSSFSEEIENVTASDWQLDADEIWGGESSPEEDFGPESGTAAFDFEM